jgi:AcrR family transcriptional regulator
MKNRDIKRKAILEAAHCLFLAQGFDKTTISTIIRQVGGSKATIYSHFGSKDGLFVACMMSAADDYITSNVALLDSSGADLGAALRQFGAGFLGFASSAESLATLRLRVAEADRSGIGRMFFTEITNLLGFVAAFLSRLMAAGVLRTDDAKLAAAHLRALLEAEVVEPLLLHARKNPPDEKEIVGAVGRAVAGFLRAYAPTVHTS